MGESVTPDSTTPESATPESATSESATSESATSESASPEDRVSLRDARNQLARLVDAVHQGSTVVITRHGRPWVRLVPLASTSPRRRSPGRCLASSSGLDPTALFAVGDRLAVLGQLQRQRRDPRGSGVAPAGR